MEGEEGGRPWDGKESVKMRWRGVNRDEEWQVGQARESVGGGGALYRCPSLPCAPMHSIHALPLSTCNAGSHMPARPRVACAAKTEECRGRRRFAIARRLYRDAAEAR